MTSLICLHVFVEKPILETINVVEEDDSNTTSLFIKQTQFIKKFRFFFKYQKQSKTYYELPKEAITLIS